MKWILPILGVLFIVGLVGFGVEQYAAESGEVVVLTTQDDAGNPVETRLWIVDHDGYQYLRAGFDGAGWVQRMTANAEVEVVRNGIGAVYTATPDPSKTDTVNRLMAEKYGWADAYIGTIFPRNSTLAFRLEPVEAE